MKEIYWLIQYNLLNLKYNDLKEQVQEDIFNKILEVSSEHLTIDNQKKEIKMLRSKIKALKEIIKGE